MDGRTAAASAPQPAARCSPPQCPRPAHPSPRCCLSEPIPRRQVEQPGQLVPIRLVLRVEGRFRAREQAKWGRTRRHPPPLEASGVASAPRVELIPRGADAKPLATTIAGLLMKEGART